MFNCSLLYNLSIIRSPSKSGDLVLEARTLDLQSSESTLACAYAMRTGPGLQLHTTTTSTTTQLSAQASSLN